MTVEKNVSERTKVGGDLNGKSRARCQEVVVVGSMLRARDGSERKKKTAAGFVSALFATRP